MFNATKILSFPLRTVKYLSDSIYAKSPDKLDMGFKMSRRYYEENQEDLERRGVEHIGIK